MGKTKLTDKQIKKIISDYAITNNQRETARLNGVTPPTVKRVITDKRNEETLKIVTQKEKENNKDMLEYIDQTFDKQKKVIDLSLKVLTDKLKNPDMFTNVKDVVTVYGILYDKALKVKEIRLREKELALKDKEDEEVINNAKDILVRIKKVADERNNN